MPPPVAVTPVVGTTIAIASMITIVVVVSRHSGGANAHRGDCDADDCDIDDNRGGVALTIKIKKI